MLNADHPQTPELELAILRVASQCKRRVRARNWLRFGAVTLALFCIFVLTLWIGKPSLTQSNLLLVLLLVVESVVAWRWLIQANRVPISLKQVALYIDHAHPELENRIVSALEFSTEDHPEASSWMIERFLEESEVLTSRTSFGDLLDRRVLRRWAVAVASVWLVAFAAVYISRTVWLPHLAFNFDGRTESALQPLPFTVEPGDAAVRVGDNLVALVKALLPNEHVAIQWRTAEGDWETRAMGTSTQERVYHHQFLNLRTDMYYQVQVGSLRSEVFKITTWLPPETTTINLVYHYPEYLDMHDEEVPNSGYITAVEGTRVDLSVAVNKKLRDATLVLASGTRYPLKAAGDALWRGQLLVMADDSYHIEIHDMAGRTSEYDMRYDITAIIDKPPSVKIDFPRGDQEVTSLEEIPFTFEVSDDFGLASYGLQLEILDREPIRLAMSLPVGNGMASGSHLLALEDLDLRAGDFVTWTVWAEDRKPGRSRYEALGDPYFLDIRPFRRTYEETVSNQQGGGQGGGQQGGASGDQKDIIIATWNLRSDANHLTEFEFEDRIGRIIESQQSLSVATMKDLPAAALEMGLAVDAMLQAALPEPGEELSRATVHEQKAHLILRRAEPDHRRVQQGRQEGGGGGGRQSELDALELNRDFYEEESSTQSVQEEAAQEAQDNLKDLAQRQSLVNEEIEKLVSELGKAETEEEQAALQRQLERLIDEQKQNIERLDQVTQDVSKSNLDNQRSRDVRQGLNEAREEMRRGLENLEQGRMQQARSAGARTSNALQEAGRALRGVTRAAAQRRMEALQERMKSLRLQQDAVMKALPGADKARTNKSLDGGDEEEEQILAQKRAVQKALRETVEEASGLANDAGESQRLMAKKLNDWLRETSREGILEDMAESGEFVRYGAWDFVALQEGQIAEKLAAASESLDEVANFLVGDDLDAMEMALQQLETMLAGTTPGSDLGAGEAQARADEGGTQDGQGRQGETGGAASGQEEGQSGNGGAGEQNTEGAGGQGQERRVGSGGGGDGNAWGGGWSNLSNSENMRQFMESGYRDWIERMRNAEALLGEDVALQRQVIRTREAVEQMRRDFLRDARAPRFDMFLENVANPIVETARQLNLKIKAMLKENEFVLTNEGDIPAQYRQKVADYFKSLSELEGQQSL